MKNAVKISAALLFIVLALLLTGVSFADESGGSITVKSALPEQSYNIYRIFELESYNPDTSSYLYRVNRQWEEFAKSATAFVRIDQRGLVSWKPNADKSFFAHSALIYATANGIKPADSKYAENGLLKFENLKMGCYLIDASLGTLCTLNSNSPSKTVEETISSPLISYEVMDGGLWKKTCSAQIGDMICSKIDITAQRGMRSFAVSSILPSGISFRQLNYITLNGNAVSAENYCAEIIANGFRVSFSKKFCENLKNNDSLTLCFNAFVDSDAILGSPGNLCSAVLDYGTASISEKIQVNIWEFNIVKFSSECPDSGKCPGLALSHNGNIVTLSQIGQTNAYRTDPVGSITNINTNSFEVIGLDTGIYYLYELGNDGRYTNVSSFTVDSDGKLVSDISCKDSENRILSVNSQVFKKNTKYNKPLVFVFISVLSLLLLGASLTAVLGEKIF